MLRRVVLYWLITLVLATGLLLENVNRRVRVAEQLNPTMSGTAWDDFPGRLLLSFVIITLAFLPIVFAGSFLRINQARVVQMFPTEETLIVAGIRNFQPSIRRGMPLERAVGLNGLATVLAASDDGFMLASGILKFGVRVRFSWEDVEDITVVGLDRKIYKIAATGISIRLREFDHPLMFAVASNAPPWIEVAPSSIVENIAEGLGALRTRAEGLPGS